MWTSVVLHCRGNTLIPSNAGTAVRDHSLNCSPYLFMYQKKQSLAYEDMLCLIVALTEKEVLKLTLWVSEWDQRTAQFVLGLHNMSFQHRYRNVGMHNSHTCNVRYGKLMWIYHHTTFFCAALNRRKTHMVVQEKSVWYDIICTPLRKDFALILSKWSFFLYILILCSQSLYT